MHIGVLNYKSRPKFTTMMTFALFICAITIFIVLSLFGQSLIQPLTVTMDDVGIEGKVILSGTGGTITQEELAEIEAATGAGYSLVDSEYAEFEISVPKASGVSRDYTVICLYAPYIYSLEENEAVLVMPVSASRDEPRRNGVCARRE